MSPEEDLSQLECMTKRLGRLASEGIARPRKMCLKCCCPNRLWNGDTSPGAHQGGSKRISGEGVCQWCVKVGVFALDFLEALASTPGAVRGLQG